MQQFCWSLWCRCMQWGPADCPDSLCWDPVTGTKFWGFVSMDVRASEFILALGE
jgi:hypothetical protein